MKKIEKNILTLSLTFAMMLNCANLLASNSDDEKKTKTKKKVDPVEARMQKIFDGKKISGCVDYLNDNSIDRLIKDKLFERKENGKIVYNSKGDDRKEDYKIEYKTFKKVNDTLYLAETTFGVYTMVSKVDVKIKGKKQNSVDCLVLDKESDVTRPETSKEKTARELKEAKEDALKSFEAYKNENVNLVDLSSDCDKASKSVKEAKNKEEVEKIKETTLASMTEKVDAAKARIAAELEAADRAKIIVEEEATAFVNDYASQLASFVKNANNMEEVLAMFANNEVEVTVSALNSANKTKTVAEYLNELSKLSNGTYKNNTQLNINVENVELLGTKAIVKVVQKFDGNGVYCDETVKSIELLKENEKVSINKIEVLETKSCK